MRGAVEGERLETTSADCLAVFRCVGLDLAADRRARTELSERAAFGRYSDPLAKFQVHSRPPVCEVFGSSGNV